MLDSFIRALPNIGLGIVVFLFFILLGRALAWFVKRFAERARHSRNLVLVFGRLTSWVVGLTGLLVSLSVVLPSFNGAQLIQVLGIGRVAIGFAFRDILPNFLAGILLLLTQPFRIGDEIKFKDFEGTVTDIQTRATMLKTYDGRLVVVPNAELYTQSVIVNTAFEIRRTEYDIGIGYGDDIDLARKLMVEAALSVPEVLDEPAPDALVLDFAPSSVNVRLRWWTHSRRLDVLRVQDQVMEQVKKKLIEHGIDLPFPVQTMLFHDQTDEFDGDRERQREGWPAGRNAVPKPKRIADSISEQAHSE